MRLSILSEALRNLVRKPSTVKYPVTRELTVAPDSRGRHYANLMKCIGCSLCAIDCPANAIAMEKLPQTLKHNPRSQYPVVDYGKCVFCYQCVFICPVKAYVTTEIFEMADYSIHTSRDLSLATMKSSEQQ
ncbi:MAG: NADH-quinone oxidoreductase subunit I [Sulfolobales archaeon]|nr:NADH-quinone oxidoreductase subunit I [Sulfolobales archaeon]MDW8083340.1 NADH-quinone oxidoreductase subunit I [Sulfolobales archaeon]